VLLDGLHLVVLQELTFSNFARSWRFQFEMYWENASIWAGNCYQILFQAEYGEDFLSGLARLISTIAMVEVRSALRGMKLLNCTDHVKLDNTRC